ncbi:MAG: hypothetical protein DSY82_04920, partial [Flavobacteriia bacterium]
MTNVNIKSDHSHDHTLEVNLPNSFSISVIMQSKPSSSLWVDEVWDAVGIVVFEGGKTQTKSIQQGDHQQLIYSGLKMKLFLDECESYYHNLMSPEPSCFIVAREEDENGEETEVPFPFLVTMSFDEAHAYLEGDD